MNKKAKPQSSSIFAYGYCLLFIFLVSFDISNAQTATTDPSEGTSLSLSLSLCVYFVINSSFHFISFQYTDMNLSNLYIWSVINQICIELAQYEIAVKQAHHMGFNLNVGKAKSVFLALYEILRDFSKDSLIKRSS